jgi:hypothetical protein
MAELTEMEIAYSCGRQLVRVGDRFHDFGYGGDWEVVAFVDDWNYSPSGLGGTPTIECKPISELPDYWKQWVKPNGNTDWCGDSVAACIARSNADVGSVSTPEVKP